MQCSVRARHVFSTSHPCAWASLGTILEAVEHDMTHQRGIDMPPTCRQYGTRLPTKGQAVPSVTCKRQPRKRALGSALVTNACQGVLARLGGLRRCPHWAQARHTCICSGSQFNPHTEHKYGLHTQTLYYKEEKSMVLSDGHGAVGTAEEQHLARYRFPHESTVYYVHSTY